MPMSNEPSRKEDGTETVKTYFSWDIGIGDDTYWVHYYTDSSGNIVILRSGKGLPPFTFVPQRHGGDETPGRSG